MRHTRLELSELWHIPRPEGEVPLALSGQRSFLLPTGAWRQENFRNWIPVFRSLYSSVGSVRHAGFAISSLPAFANSKSPESEESTNSCNPQTGKPIGKPKELSPYITFVCPLQDPRETHLHSCRINHRPTIPAGPKRVFDMIGQP